MRPPRHKFALINWIAIYPLITLILWAAGPVLFRLPLYIETLIVSVVLVAAMNFVMMPLMLRVFSFWLRPKVTAVAAEPTADSDASAPVTASN
jgi:antibiotic biosynthesis monooxygenase (ABM) superfamily enzyme